MITLKNALVSAISIVLCCLFVIPGVAQAAEEEKDVLLGSLPGVASSDGRAAYGVAFDQVNNTLLVAASNGESPAEVRVFPAGGGASIGALPIGEAPPGGIGTISVNFPTGIAVDPQGDVYVSDVDHRVVDKFEPVGNPRTSTEFKYVCQYSGTGRGCMFNPELELGSPSTFGFVSGLAVDSSGDLYVADHEFEVPADPESENAVDEFNSMGGDVAQFKASDHPLLGAPQGVAVDAAGDLFALDLAHQVVELQRGAKGEVLSEKVLSTESAVVAVTFDLDAGLLLIFEDGPEHGQVRAYSPESKTFPGFQFLTPPTRPAPSAVAVQETPGGMTGDVYVEEREYRRVEIYGTPPPLKPAVSGESVAAVTSSSAQLSATVEPELRATHYVFQFGADQSYSGGELPAAPGGEVPGTQASALTSVSLTGLAAGATYHYRVVATNKEGTTYGPDQTFTTFGPLEAGLPDGRVWEMVSPLEKNGGAISGAGATQASANGEKVTYISPGAFAGPHGNNVLNQYISTRGASGWGTENISPAEEAASYLGTYPFQAFSSDLSRSLLRNGGRNQGLPIKNQPIEGTGAPEGYSNVYVRDDETNTFQALLTSTPTIPDSKFFMAIEAVTPDLGHIVERGYDNNSQDSPELDEWSGGAAVPVNVGVHGGLVQGAVIGSGSTEGSDEPHVLSDDGSRVFWSVGGDAVQGSEPVFVREGIGGADPRTVQLPAGEFVDASAQTGSKVLLSTGEVFDLELGAHGERLADLTEGAGGFVGELGSSEDLSKIYFVDTAALPGAGANSFGAMPQAGGNNLYLYSEGASPRFIATLVAGSQDKGDWSNTLGRTTRVTAGGETLLFDSVASLTGYDNRPAEPADCQKSNGLGGAETGPCSEIYLYHADTGALACVSCNPTGERPVGGSSISGGHEVEEDETRAYRVYYQPRVLSADGSRVFFNSPEALVEQDKNHAADVYEYENGHVYLISSGTGTGSSFVDASENGDNVFFTTANELVPGDTDQLVDLYDARVDGGFPAPATPPACTGTGCQGIPAAPPIFATPSSGTFAGVGNFPASLTGPVVKPKVLTRAQKLVAALKACHAKRGKKRSSCEATARRKYGTAKKAAAKKGGKARK